MQLGTSNKGGVDIEVLESNLQFPTSSNQLIYIYIYYINIDINIISVLLTYFSAFQRGTSWLTPHLP